MVTINIQFVYLGFDRHFFLLALEQLLLDDLDETHTGGIELYGEVRGVHLDRLAIRFIVNIFLAPTEGSGIGCSGESVDFLRGRGSKVDEPF